MSKNLIEYNITIENVVILHHICNKGTRNFILVLLHANFTYLDVLTSVLSENSMKEVLLLLFSELLAQPGRACLLCFTPEFDKVLVSLAHRCLGASLCQIRELSAIG